MASRQLQAFQERFFNERAVDVTHQQFVEDPANVKHGEIIDEEAAYPTDVTLKALITYSPNLTLRHALGLQEDVHAVVSILVSECDDKGISPTSRDRFKLPGEVAPFYVAKAPAPFQQQGDMFFRYHIALIRKAGGKRNR